MNRGEVDEAELKERQARAMADPEVQGILSDPIMRQVGRAGQGRPPNWAAAAARQRQRASPGPIGPALRDARAAPAPPALLAAELHPPLRRSLTPPLPPSPAPPLPQVLQDMQEDPRAAQQHMRHPEIAKKIEKLVAAGILQIR